MDEEEFDIKPGMFSDLWSFVFITLILIAGAICMWTVIGLIVIAIFGG